MMMFAGLMQFIAMVLCIICNVIAVVYAWLGQRWRKGDLTSSVPVALRRRLKK